MNSREWNTMTSVGPVVPTFSGPIITEHSLYSNHSGTTSSMPPAVTDTSSTSVTEEKRHMCKICDCPVGSGKVYKEHCRGKKHQARMKELSIAEKIPTIGQHPPPVPFSQPAQPLGPTANNQVSPWDANGRGSFSSGQSAPIWQPGCGPFPIPPNYYAPCPPPTSTGSGFPPCYAPPPCPPQPGPPPPCPLWPGPPQPGSFPPNLPPPGPPPPYPSSSSAFTGTNSTGIRPLMSIYVPPVEKQMLFSGPILTSPTGSKTSNEPYTKEPVALFPSGPVASVEQRRMDYNSATDQKTMPEPSYSSLTNQMKISGGVQHPPLFPPSSESSAPQSHSPPSTSSGKNLFNVPRSCSPYVFIAKKDWLDMADKTSRELAKQEKGEVQEEKKSTEHRPKSIERSSEHRAVNDRCDDTKKISGDSSVQKESRPAQQSVMVEGATSEFFCPLCQIRTRDVQSFRAHLACALHVQNAKEKGQKFKTFKCDICNVRGLPYSDEEFMKHLTSKQHLITKAFLLNDLIRLARDTGECEGRNEKRYIFKFNERGGGLVECTLCNRVFPTTVELLSHQQSSTHETRLTTLGGKYPVLHFCQLCEASQLSKNEWFKHIRSQQHNKAVGLSMGEDCPAYYSLEVCKLGGNCPFRHTPESLSTTIPCADWMVGRCNRAACPSRHPPRPMAVPMEGRWCPDPGPAGIPRTLREPMVAKKTEDNAKEKIEEQVKEKILEQAREKIQEEARKKIQEDPEKKLEEEVKEKIDKNANDQTDVNVPKQTFSLTKANVDFLKSIVESKLAKSTATTEAVKPANESTQTEPKKKSSDTVGDIDRRPTVKPGQAQPPPSTKKSDLLKQKEALAKCLESVNTSADCKLADAAKLLTALVDLGSKSKSKDAPKVQKPVKDQPKKSVPAKRNDEVDDWDFLFSRLTSLRSNPNGANATGEDKDDAMDELLTCLLENEKRKPSQSMTQQLKVMLLEKLVEKRKERRETEKMVMTLLGTLAKRNHVEPVNSSNDFGGTVQDDSGNDARELAMDYFLRSAGMEESEQEKIGEERATDQTGGEDIEQSMRSQSIQSVHSSTSTIDPASMLSNLSSLIDINGLDIGNLDANALMAVLQHSAVFQQLLLSQASQIMAPLLGGMQTESLPAPVESSPSSVDPPFSSIDPSFSSMDPSFSSMDPSLSWPLIDSSIPAEFIPQFQAPAIPPGFSFTPSDGSFSAPGYSFPPPDYSFPPAFPGPSAPALQNLPPQIAQSLDTTQFMNDNPIALTTGLNAVHSFSKEEMESCLRRFTRTDARTAPFVFGGKDWAEIGQQFAGEDEGTVQLEDMSISDGEADEQPRPSWEKLAELEKMNQRGRGRKRNRSPREEERNTRPRREQSSRRDRSRDNQRRRRNDRRDLREKLTETRQRRGDQGHSSTEGDRGCIPSNSSPRDAEDFTITISNDRYGTCVDGDAYDNYGDSVMWG